MRRLLACALVLFATSASAQTISGDRFRLNTGPCTMRSGAGSPEGAVTGAVCDVYHQTDSPYTVWFKTSGAGDTGWERLSLAQTATAGQALRSTANGEPAWSTATYPATAATAGAYLRADGTNWITSTLVLPNAATTGDLFSASAANTASLINAVAAGQVLTSAGVGTLPAWSASPSLTSIGGAANLELNPTGDLTIDPTGNDALPETNYDINLGSLSKKYLSLHAAELWVETLVAQNTIATIGGRVLVAPTNILVADMAPEHAAFYTKYNNLAIGDIVYLESSGKVEFGLITAGPTVEGDHYVYWMTRDLDGSGANQWYAGDAVLNTGTTGDGFIDLYSVSGVLSGAGPTIVGNVRTHTDYNDIAPRWAIGNLNGLYGYGVDTYGSAFGDSAETWMSMDSTNGFRVMHGAAVLSQIDAAGNATFTGTVNATAGYFGDGATRVAVEAAGINVGNTGSIRGGQTAYNTGDGFWLGYVAGDKVYKFSIGGDAATDQKFTFDGTDVYIGAKNVKLFNGDLTLESANGGAYWLWTNNDADDNKQIELGADNVAGNTAYFKLYPAEEGLAGWNARPACAAGTLGALFLVDTDSTLSNFAVCVQNADDSYAWRNIAGTGNTSVAGTMTSTGDVTTDADGNAAINIDAGADDHYAQLIFKQAGTQTWNFYAAAAADPYLAWSNPGHGVLMTLGHTGVLTLSALASGNLTSASGVITSSSDERLKDISGPLTYGLAEVLRLRPIRGHWNKESGIPTEPEHGWFGAAQVEPIMPLAVSYGPNGMRGLDTTVILAAVVNGEQEIDARLRAVEAKLGMSVTLKAPASTAEIQDEIAARKAADQAVLTERLAAKPVTGIVQ